MKYRKILKKLFVIMLLSTVLIINNPFKINESYGYEIMQNCSKEIIKIGENDTLGDPFDNPNSWKPTDNFASNGEIIVNDANRLKEIGNKITYSISTFASIISAIFILLIGIKYMLGSVEERAEYKESMKPFLIGNLLIFGIVNILKIIMSIANNLN